MVEHVFITGASGCVGHYLVDELASDPRYHLHLLVRDPSRLRFDWAGRSNLSLVVGDVLDLERFAPMLAEMDHMIYAAAAWGDPVSYEINFHAPHRMFALANPERIKQIVNFSTASILDPDNELLPEAEKEGTDYIRSKYLACKHLDEHPFMDRITTVFPTLIFGGSDRHPSSHLTSGLKEVERWLPLARFVTLEGTLHFIHARDIARIVKHVLVNSSNERRLVLGNAAMSVDRLLPELCEAYGVKRGPKVDLTAMATQVTRLFNRRMNSWDHFSLRYRHFTYHTVNAETYGLPIDLTNLQAIVNEARSHA